MSFFSHSSRIRILQLTFGLVRSCSEDLLTTEKHHLVPFCFLIFPTTFIRGVAGTRRVWSGRLSITGKCFV